MDVRSSHFCAPRCRYIGRTLVLESEGSKPIPLMEKYMHILTGLFFLFMYLFDVSMCNMNGPSGIMCMETSKYVCFWGGTWQIKVFHIAARIPLCLRPDYCFVQWPMTLVVGHCMSPSWWGCWPLAVCAPSTRTSWQPAGQVVSAVHARTYPLLQNLAATWGWVGFCLRGLIASQNIFSHQIIIRVISLYPKLSVGRRSNA